MNFHYSKLGTVSIFFNIFYKIKFILNTLSELPYCLNHNKNNGFIKSADIK